MLTTFSIVWRGCASAALCALALGGSSAADIPPLPMPPSEPPPAVAPEAIHALAGRYEIRNAAGSGICVLTLEAEHHDLFVEGQDDFQVSLDDEAQACLSRVFTSVGYAPSTLVWNVTYGGGIALRFEGNPPQPWLSFAPDRESRGFYQVETRGQMVSLVSQGQTGALTGSD